MKRVFDVLFSFSMIIITSPILIVTSVLIKIESLNSPVLFKQIRTGKGNQPFKIFKFRSMKSISRNNSPLTVGNDSRITKVGKYIRKFKIDELPQFFNVLKGDMSVVGPRPEIPEFTNMYNEKQLKVLSMRPGITDNASILYFNEGELLAKSSNPKETYINEVMPDKLKMNMEYFENRTIIVDFKIIFKTLLKILR